ncbi:MAG: zeta toxin family protein [Parcubacteria group bacterium]|nr:zeta toxin family protein [Parcubacteria group bacterium]
MTAEEEKLRQEAIVYVKNNRQLLIEKFVNPSKYQAVEKPVTLFMAGSPGAGKTEVSKRLMEKFEKNIPVRIDPDDIRKILPGYVGGNAFVFQAACSVAVDKLYDYIIDAKLNVIVDGTFASERVVLKNIERSLKHGRKIEIYYIYQDPKLAWEFTQAREEKEGRRIPRDGFIDAFVGARENVNMVKRRFESKIELNLIINDYLNKIEIIKPDIDNVDKYLPNLYTVDNLKEIIGV